IAPRTCERQRELTGTRLVVRERGRHQGDGRSRFQQRNAARGIPSREVGVDGRVVRQSHLQPVLAADGPRGGDYGVRPGDDAAPGGRDHPEGEARLRASRYGVAGSAFALPRASMRTREPRTRDPARVRPCAASGSSANTATTTPPRPAEAPRTPADPGA